MGVMSLFYIAIADVAMPEEQRGHGGMWKYVHSWAGTVAIGCIAIGAIYYYSLSTRFNHRQNYEPVPNSSFELSA